MIERLLQKFSEATARKAALMSEMKELAGRIALRLARSLKDTDRELRALRDQLHRLGVDVD